MKSYYDKKDGYRETIQRGLLGANNFSGSMTTGKGTREE